MKKNKTLLVIAAHPDDEVLGCGGTVARYAKDGYKCYILIMAEGVTARGDSRDTEKVAAALEEVKLQAQEAAKILGAEDVYFNSFADNRMDSVDFLDVVKSAEKVIKKVNPSIVFTHNQSDLNIDHAITAKAVITATRPMPDCPVHELYSFEVLSSTEWAFSEKENVFQPNTFIDISSTLNEKIEALSVYSSEIREFPHPRSAEAIEALAKTRGAQAGMKAAEAFCVIRNIVDKD